MKDTNNTLIENYKTISKHLTNEFEEKKSVFITDSIHVETEKEALDFIDEIKKKYKDATHHCSAYIINENPIIKRYNDDGEPTYTAGIPILSVLEKLDLKNIVVVVTRYFGGKELGKGGLSRAYGKACSDCLNEFIVYKKNFDLIEILFDYTNLGIIENYLLENSYYIVNKEYTDKVKITLYIDSEISQKFISGLIELTSDNVIINSRDAIMLFYDGNKIITGV